METMLQTYSTTVVPQVAQQVTLQAIKRAPNTVSLGILGIIIGAVIDEARGALILGGICAGIGYAADCYSKSKH